MYLSMTAEEAWDGNPPNLRIKGDIYPAGDVELWVMTHDGSIQCKTYYRRPGRQNRSSYGFGEAADIFARLSLDVRVFARHMKTAAKEKNRR